jgi:hypothetical protein
MLLPMCALVQIVIDLLKYEILASPFSPVCMYLCLWLCVCLPACVDFFPHSLSHVTVRQTIYSTLTSDSHWKQNLTKFKILEMLSESCLKQDDHFGIIL